MADNVISLSDNKIENYQFLINSTTFSPKEKNILLDPENKNKIYLLINENKITGYALFSNTADQNFHGHIEFHILPEYQNKGKGKFFFSMLLEEARKKEIAQVKITCSKKNIKAIKIIKNFNYKLEETFNDYNTYWIDLPKEKACRYSIKAIIIENNKLLVERCDYGRGRFSKLPGGGQNWGETITEALIRECKEELNIDVEPQKLVLIRDYIAKNHPSKIGPYWFHQVEPMFICNVKDYSTLGKGNSPDGINQEIVWLDLNTIETSDFYPKAIIPYLKNIQDIKETIYLGDVN